jgi:hypothetical protein
MDCLFRTVGHLTSDALSAGEYGALYLVQLNPNTASTRRRRVTEDCSQLVAGDNDGQRQAKPSQAQYAKHIISIGALIIPEFEGRVLTHHTTSHQETLLVPIALSVELESWCRAGLMPARPLCKSIILLKTTRDTLPCLHPHWPFCTESRGVVNSTALRFRVSQG